MKNKLQKKILFYKICFLFFVCAFFLIPQKIECKMIADTLVIYQVINGYEGDAEKDAIVLYNPTNDSISLNGISIKQGGAATLFDLSGAAFIQPYKYYLIGDTSDLSVEGIEADEIQNLSISGAASVDKTWVGIFYNSGNDTIDLVGFGTHASNITAEGNKISEDLATGNSLMRKPADLFAFQSSGMLNTNNNQNDFKKTDSIPTPKNSAAPTEKLAFTISVPESAEVGANFSLSCSTIVVYNGITYNDSVVTDYTGASAWADITVSGGSISANTTGLFVNGILTDTFNITAITGNVVITISDGYCTGSAVINITSPISIAQTPVITYPISQDTSAVSFQLIGAGGANDSVIIYVNNNLAGEIKIDNDSNWIYSLNAGNGLIANDTNIIKAVAYATGKIYSDTAILTIFIDTAPPTLITQLNINDTIYRNIFFNANLFNDSSSIDTYTIEFSFDEGFTNPIIYISSAAAVSIRLEEEGTYYTRVKATDKFNQESQYSNTDSFILIMPKVVINEFNSDNTVSSNPPDANGDGSIDNKDDFIELYNFGNTPVNLKNWKIGRIDNFEITLPDITILANEFITIFCSSDSEGFNVAGRYLFNSSLSLLATSSGSYYLFDDSNDTIDFITTVTSGDSEIDADQSITRYPDGTGAFIKSSLIHPAGKKATPNLPYNDMDGYCTAQISPLSIIMGETFQLNIAINIDTNFAGGTIAITLPDFFPVFSNNINDSGYYTYTSSKILSSQNFIEQTNKLYITLTNDFEVGDTFNILFGASDSAVINFPTLINDTIIVSSSDSNVYGGLAVAGVYQLIINLPVITPPVITSPINNFKTSNDSININVSINSKYIGDTLILYKNNVISNEIIIDNTEMIFSNISLTANDSNYFYCVIADTYYQNLFSDSSDILTVLNDSRGPIPTLFIFDDTYILTPTLSFDAFIDSSNISFYILLIDDSPDFTSPDTYTAAVSSINIDTPLNAGTNYYIKIKAIDEFNNIGEFSDSVIMRISEPLPTPVINYPMNIFDTNAATILITGTVAGHPEIEKVLLFVDNILIDTADLMANGIDSSFSFIYNNSINDTHIITVRALNKNNGVLSDPSNSIIFLYDTLGPAPVTINFDDKYNTSVILDFDDFSDSSAIDTYYIVISKDSEFADSAVYASKYSYLQFIADYNLYFVKIQAVDKFNNTGEFSNTDSFTVSPLSAASYIVISEVAVGVGDASTEFIELYNPTSQTIDISAYQLRINGTNIPLVFRNKFILSYGFYLLSTDNFSSGDAYWSGGKLSGGGGSAIQLLDASDNVIDAVAWSLTGSGHDDYKEGEVITLSFNTNMAIERKAKYNSTSASMTTGADSLVGNAFDSNNNAFDFVVNNFVNYQNSDSSYEIPFGFTNEDTLPPSAVTDLQTTTKFENGAVLLTWSRVSDNDKYSGNIYVKYIIKYSDTEILNDLMFNNAALITDTYTNLNDTYLSYTVGNLVPGNKYYFAVKVYDRFNNISELSNTVGVNAYILPTTVSSNIANNSSGILPSAPLILTFSDSMDTNSVLNNLSITHAIDSNLQWTNSNQLTISANWSLDSNYRIKIAADNALNETHTAKLDGNNNKIFEGSPTDDYILNFSTAGNFISVPSNETSLYDTYVNNILLTSENYTIYLNNSDTIRLNIIGLNENDRWVITFDQPDTGYYLSISTAFAKTLTDTSFKYMVNNTAALDRMMKISVLNSYGAEIENADYNLKYYYSAVAADKTKLGIFKNIAFLNNKLDMREINNRNFIANTVSADNYEINNDYIGINVKKTGYFAVANRMMLAEFINYADTILTLSNADSVVCANLQVSGAYTGDTIQTLILKSYSSLNNDSVNIYSYIDNVPFGILDGTDTFIAMLEKSNIDSKLYNLDQPVIFSDKIKLLFVADFKNIKSGDSFEIYIDTGSLDLSAADNSNSNKTYKSKQLITFAEYSSSADFDTVVINEVCITPKTNWSAVNYRYDINNLPEATESTSATNEYIELYNSSSKIIDLTNWSLTTYKTSTGDTLIGTIDLTNYSTNVYFSKGGNASKFYPGEYLVIGRPYDLVQNIGVYLYKDTRLIDSASFGNFDDGNTADNAAAGSASSQSDESLSRYPNGIDTNNDADNFVKMNGTPGMENIILPTKPVITFPTIKSEYINYLNSIVVEGNASNTSDGVKVFVDNEFCATVSIKNNKWSVMIDTAAGLNLSGTTVVKVFTFKTYGDIEYKSGETSINIISGIAAPIINILLPTENIFEDAGIKNLIFDIANHSNLKSVQTKLNNEIIANYAADDKIYISALMQAGRNTLNAVITDIFNNTATDTFEFYVVGSLQTATDSTVILDTLAFSDTSLFSVKIASADTINIFAPLNNNSAVFDTFNISLNMINDEARFVMINKVDTNVYKNGFNNPNDYDKTAYTIFEIKVMDKRGNYSAGDTSIFDSIEIRYDFSETSKNNFEVNKLLFYTFNEQTQKWEKLPDADCVITDDYVSARLSHFSIYGVFASSILNASQTNINNAVVYPSPFIPNDNNPRTGVNYTGADNGSGIYIAGILQNTKIEIFDIAGRKIFDTTTTDDKAYYQWNVKTNNGAAVASGVYVVVITNNGQRVVKKIGIIK